MKEKALETMSVETLNQSIKAISKIQNTINKIDFLKKLIEKVTVLEKNFLQNILSNKKTKPFSCAVFGY